MKKQILSMLLIALAFASTAIAQRLPAHYPSEGFQRTGIVDAVLLEENRIVIGDISYPVSKDIVIHSLTAKDVSIARLRPGVHVGIRNSRSRVLTELWLLPSNYDPTRR